MNREPIFQKTPDAIEREYRERRGARVARKLKDRPVAYAGGATTEADHRRTAAQFRTEKCMTAGCGAVPNFSGWCNAHQETRKRALDLDPLMPGRCNAPVKKSRNARCKARLVEWRDHDGRCASHRGVTEEAV